MPLPNTESDIITDFGGVEASGEGEMVYQSPSEQPEAKKTKDEPSNGKLSPEEAFEALLDGQRTDHTPVPDPAPERPVGESASDDDRRGKDRIGTGSKKPSRPSGDGKRRLAKRKSQSRLRSYVVHDGGEKKDDIDTISAKRRYTVSQAGVKRVLVHERACGRTPTEMPHYNKGYDVKSLGVGGSVRYIEVKSLSGEWSRRNAAGLTKPQFETARTYGEQFWLYVVEWATEDKARIHCIQDPANQVNQYLFDDGLDVLAETG